MLSACTTILVGVVSLVSEIQNSEIIVTFMLILLIIIRLMVL